MPLFCYAMKNGGTDSANKTERAKIKPKALYEEI
jgi:hypothetical protein